jgi:hypothetical protein
MYDTMMMLDVTEQCESEDFEDWWGYAEEAKSKCPPDAAPILEDGVWEVLVDEATADAFLKWAEAMPGWEGEHKHGGECNPVRVSYYSYPARTYLLTST